MKKSIGETVIEIGTILQNNFIKDEKTGNYYYKEYKGQKKIPLSVYKSDDYDTPTNSCFFVDPKYLTKIRKELTRVETNLTLNNKDVFSRERDKLTARYHTLASEVRALLQIDGLNASMGEISTFNYIQIKV